MERTRFDIFTRSLASGPRRILLRTVVTIAINGTPLPLFIDNAAGKKKKKKKHPTKPTCSVPYFDCHGECRLSGACCAGLAGYDCAERYPGDDGRWVCCTQAGFGCYNLDNDKFNCGACAHECGSNEICCSGECRFGVGPCPPG